MKYFTPVLFAALALAGCASQPQTRPATIDEPVATSASPSHLTDSHPKPSVFIPPPPPTFLSKTPSHDEDELINAGFDGNTAAASQLIAKGININVQDRNGRTALMWAATHEHLDTLKLLLARGANPNIVNSEGDTALIWAAQHENTAIIRALITAKANPNIRNSQGETALTIAEQDEQPAVVKLLNQSGAKR